MIDDSGRELGQPRRLELVEQLSDAKFAIPARREGFVSRAHLIEAARSQHHRVVGVTAPAGYGKSTMLAEWAASEDRRVAWVSLDRFDDDPATFVTQIASAFGGISGRADLSDDVHGLGVSTLARAVPRLIRALHTSASSFVLMLDDLQELRSPACHDVLGLLITGIPAGSQLVVASRTEQPHLPRLRASGEASELGPSDLRLDAAGAAQIFSMTRTGISRQQAAIVTERTEGWPVGIYLAALIAGDRVEGAPAISGDDRFVADYLYREALQQLPEDLQRFLRSTAVLDQLCAPLCDAILEEGGAQARLRDLEARSLFLVGLDRRRGWYRYHALFREFLLAELHRVDPGAVVGLHIRAADWYEANGSPALAIEHVMNTPERERCVRLVARMALPTYQAGQAATVQRWLSTLGDDAVKAYPPLVVLAGWIAVLSGNTMEAERCAAFLEDAAFTSMPVDGSASFASSRAMLRAAMCPAGPQQMVDDADFARAHEPAWGPWRALALVLSAEARLLTADPDQARGFFVETTTAATLGNINAVILSHSELAVMAMDGGRWTEAPEHVRAAVGMIEEFHVDDYAMSVMAFAVAARLAAHRGDRHEVDRRLAQAMRWRPLCTFVIPHVAVRSRIQLVKVYLTLGDISTARHLMHEIDEILIRRPDLGALVGEVASVREVVTTSEQSPSSHATPLTPAELRLLPYLQTHLTFREIGERLFVTRNTVATQVGSIYRKLGVSSRRGAVDAATTVGLLGG